MSSNLFGRLQDELDQREKAAGLSMADVMDLPDHLRRLMNWLIRRQEMGLAEIAAFLKEDEPQTQAMLAELVEKGLVREMRVQDNLRYRVRLGQRRPVTLAAGLWQALEDKTTK